MRRSALDALRDMLDANGELLPLSTDDGVDLFRLPHRASATYVSSRFVERVREAGLRGLSFEKVWSG